MAAKQIVVATGANSGIGFQTALHFARAGAKVVMGCRNINKAEDAQQRIRQEVPEADTLILPLDVSELSSVREFGQLFAQQVGELDVLINNAGIVGLPLMRTSAGHEMQLATNYLGAFTLTSLLLPHFRKNKAARIVNVGSIAHRFGKLNVEDLNWETTQYDQWKAYANSKVALLSHTLELNRRLQEQESHVIALAAHPGVANTNITTQSDSLKPPGRFKLWYRQQMTRFIPTAADAARAIILAATADHVRGGEYYGPGGPLELGGKPKQARLNPVAQDPQLSRRLWGLTEHLTGAQFL